MCTEPAGTRTSHAASGYRLKLMTASCTELVSKQTHQSQRASATHSTIGAVGQLLSAHVPTQTMLVFFVGVGRALGAKPPGVRRSLPARSRHGKVVHLPDQHLPRCCASNKGAVRRKSKSNNWRIHSQEAFRFGFGLSRIPDQDCAVVAARCDKALVVGLGL